MRACHKRPASAAPSVPIDNSGLLLPRGNATLRRNSRRGRGVASFGHSDRPIERLEDDCLDLARYAKSLAEFIRYCETPITIAIQGFWGTGKTSLMSMVEQDLKRGPTKVHSIWFNTWRYSQFATHDALPISLLSSLLGDIADQDRSLLNDALTVFGRLAKPAANVIVRAGTGGAVEVADFKSIPAAIDPAAEAEKLRGLIREAVEKRVAKGEARIVIFVDDLDRIVPERAVEVLEIIKLFLDWPHCVFVLALDYEVVSEGLRKKLGIAADKVIDHKRFFDKLIQLPFSIPVEQYDTTNYVASLIKKMGLSLGAEDTELFEELIARTLTFNPRAVKRVLNRLQLLLLVWKGQDSPGRKKHEDRLVVRNLFALLCLQIGVEPFYRWLASQELEGNGGLETAKNALLALARWTSGDGSELDKILDEAKFDGKPDTVRAFIPQFLRCIQTPGESDDEYSQGELERLRDTLTLTRVTAVELAAEAVDQQTEMDREFGRRNRQMMDSFARRLNEQLKETRDHEQRSARSYKPHSNPSAQLLRVLCLRPWIQAAISHDAESAKLMITGSARPIQAAALALHSSPFSKHDKYMIGDYEIVIDELSMDKSMGFADREDLLAKTLVPKLVELDRFFEGLPS
jgi:hypothetical protein